MEIEIESGPINAMFQDNWSQRCVTDDGGPLICNGKLYGILSFVGGCTAKQVK